MYLVAGLFLNLIGGIFSLGLTTYWCLCDLVVLSSPVINQSGLGGLLSVPWVDRPLRYVGGFPPAKQTY